MRDSRTGKCEAEIIIAGAVGFKCMLTEGHKREHVAQGFGQFDGNDNEATKKVGYSLTWVNPERDA